MRSPQYDIAVIGGGINGVGIARDAAGRGYKVLLAEQDDLASHTSSSSSKLIHGGLRYLEFYEFKLVREALKEREVLLNIAPHIIWPLSFVLPHHPDMRPVWMIRAGLWLYDHLGKRKKLAASKAISFHRHISGPPLKSNYKKGFIYSDCWVQDSRLVILNAMDAAEHGAKILTRTKCVSAVAENNRWELCFQDETNKPRFASAKMLVNATGPWVAEFLDSTLKFKHDQSIRLVSGSHIVVRKIFEHEMAYIFQNKDGRIIFAIPYESQYTLIGTTEREVEHSRSGLVTENEIDYLCNSVNHYFNQQISKDDVIWCYSGIRPLLSDSSDDATSTSREYRLDMQKKPVPFLSVFGGKITTYRSLAENAMELIDLNFGKSTKSWTATRPLPGGYFANADFEGYLKKFHQQRPWLPIQQCRHYVRNYGTQAQLICKNANSLTDLGIEIGNGLFAAEINYLIKYEWVKTCEDLLWRRTKWGLHLDAIQITALNNYFLNHVK